jgi:putative addiction module killer protein
MVTLVLPCSMSVAVREYLDAGGKSPFARWFAELESQAAAKIATALYRLEQGNFSNVEGVGSGVYEYKVNFGPGYRVYFGKDGDKLVILLGGGSKKRQSTDISAALACWQDYKRRRN